jgi:ParB-like chromosome segregation protein Spo0J
VRDDPRIALRTHELKPNEFVWKEANRQELPDSEGDEVKMNPKDPTSSIEPKIDQEIEALLPKLGEEETAALTAKIRREGMLHPIMVWEEENILLDGHNRLRICQQLNVGYEIEYMSFKTRDEAIEWVFDNQFARRNIDPKLRAYYRGEEYLRRKKAAHRPAETNKSEPGSELTGQNDAGKTAELLGAKHKLSPRTIEKNAQFAAAVDALPPDKKAAALAPGGPTMKETIAAAKPVTWRDVPLKDAVKADSQLQDKFDQIKAHTAGDLWDAIENKTIPSVPSAVGFIPRKTQDQLRIQLENFRANHKGPSEPSRSKPSPKPKQGLPDVDWKDWDNTIVRQNKAIDHFFRQFPAEFNKGGVHKDCLDAVAKANHDFREAFTTLTTKKPPSMSGGPS